MRMLAELLAGSDTPRVRRPKWMEGMRVCPILLHGHLWWDCAPMLMVRGGPPIGCVFEHSEPHAFPNDFGPSGRGVQVAPAEKDVIGILTLRDQLGDTRARCMWQHFKLANQMIAEDIWWFAYPAPDPDEDHKPPLIGMVRHSHPAPDWDGHSEPTFVDSFVPVAFVSQVALSLHNFLSQEEIDRLPRFRGTSHKERGDE